MNMNEPAKATPSQLPETAPKTHWRFFVWPDTVWFNLAVSAIIGLIYVFIVMGPKPLNPRNTSWLLGDGSTYFIGWEMLRQDPHLHWPLTFTERLGYPLGVSTALMDPIPLLELIFRPLSPVLPEPFQYLGIAAVLSCVLQLYFSLRLFRFLLGSDPFAVVLPSLFFLLAPPLNMRLGAHFALTNHWLIVASLYLLVRAVHVPKLNFRRFSIYTVLLGFTAAAINPYLAFLVLAVQGATIATLLWQGRLTWVGSAAIMLGLFVTCCAVSSAVGLPLAGAGGYSGNGGYRLYSMNLLALIDPSIFPSMAIPRLPELGDAQLEGYNYIGLGILILAGALLPFLDSRRHRLSLRAYQIVPLAACCTILTLMALSTKISLGSRILLDLDPAEHLTRFLAPLRASGRLFWVPYYVLLTTILAATFLFFRRRVAIPLVLFALAVQIADTSSLRRWVYSQSSQDYHPTPLKSPVWSTIGAHDKNLMVMPPWECDSVNTPGGSDGFRIFGFLAVNQRMRTNSYYAARYSTADLEYLCGDSLLDLLRTPLRRDTAYVVNASMAALIAASPFGSESCHDVDGFILCSSALHSGLPASQKVYLSRLNANRFVYRGDQNPGRLLLAGWYLGDPGAPWAWSNGRGVFAFVLTPEQRSHYTRMVLHLAVLVGHEGVKYSVLSTESEVNGTALGVGTASTPDVTVEIPLRSGMVQVFEIVTKNPPRPIDLGLNEDQRRIGAGLVDASLKP
jgi:Family of unknown function (DUF6311)